MNAPLPTFDMMTGQQIISQPPVQRQSASMQCDQSNVVHLQLLDRLVVVPSAVVHVSLQSCNSVAEPDARQNRPHHDTQLLILCFYITGSYFAPLCNLSKRSDAHRSADTGLPPFCHLEKLQTLIGILERRCSQVTKVRGVQTFVELLPLACGCGCADQSSSFTVVWVHRTHQGQVYWCNVAVHD